ncbi:collagen binding domain-containing protein [Paenibacillus sp. TC-CSREp1]|uniref:collagen binding domain-containing protein n=1 Tax=Paenibacillus sp. TC-CSREp1 TaxID=3410089 RepID=UPI003D03D233
MKKRVSIMLIALLLVTQLLQGLVLTSTVYAQDDTNHMSVGTMNDSSSPSVQEESTLPEDQGDQEDQDAAADEETSPAIEDTEHTASPEEAEPADVAPLAAAAAASEIQENLITSVQMYNQKPEEGSNGQIEVRGDKIEDIRPRISDEVAVVFTWGFGDDAHAYGDGSTFTFRLPDKFIIGSQLMGSLDGGVGEYVVNPDGTIVFTFNEMLEHAQLEGIFYVWLRFEESKMEDGLKQKIDFSSTGQGIINVHFANTARDELQKSGKANKNNFNSDEIEWTVDFNQGEKIMTNVVLEDTLPSGLSLQGDIEIRELQVQLNGSVKEGPVVDRAAQFPVDLGDINKAYRITYTTSVQAPTSAPYTGVVYSNEVTLTADQSEYNESDVGRVTVSFNEPLNKSGQESAYDPVTQTITWKVQYNYNQQTITQANAWIEDRFDTAKQRLVTDSLNVYEVEIQSDGRPGAKTLVVSSEYTVNGVGTGFEEGFKLQFNSDINKAYEIEYKTQAIHRVYENETIVNTVNTQDGTTKEGRKNIEEVILAKSVKSEDFNAKEIEWQIVLNRDQKEMTDIVITDDYSGRHMKLVPGSLQISGDQKDQFEVTPAVSDPADVNFEKGFRIHLKQDGIIDKQHVITYKTSFDPTAGMPTNNEYRNTATLNWKEADIAQAAIAKSAVVRPQSYTIENGNKRGDYSARDKAMTWTIDVNYNLFDIQEAILKDAYIGNQSFVDGSLKVYELELKGANNVTSVGNEITISSAQFQLDPDGKGFTLNLGDIGKKAYRVVYQTSLDGEFAVEGSYSNHAVLTDGEGGPVRFDKTAAVTPAHGGVYVNKTGRQEGTSDLASWVVNVNPSQSFVAAGSQLTDTLSSNQILLADSLKLYEVQLPANNSGNVSVKAGLVDPSEYDLLVNGNTFTFTFKNDINTAYLLEYQSYINADDGDRIENKVEFADHSFSVVGEGNQSGIRVSLAGAGGGASTGLGKVKVHKIDDTGKPLEGVIFAIYNASGTVLLETMEPTDENGMTESSRNYRLHLTTGIPYRLKEVAAPAGYLPDPNFASAAGHTILFKDAEAAFEIINEQIRQGFELTKLDVADSTKVLEGATFELYHIQGSTREKLDELTTGVGGRIAKGDLEAGTYELIEIQAPEFYMVDSTPIPFTITANQTQIVTLTKTNQIGTGGKLTLTKVNAKDQSPLSGVEFELRDSANNVVDTGVTNQQGIIEFSNLTYGVYTLVETKAEGFVIETPETKVPINQPDTQITIENKENDRSVKLVKYNASRTQHLQGAVFELRAQSAVMGPDGEWLFNVVTGIDPAALTTDLHGELHLQQLEPNTYQLVEVKAPSGYQLERTPVTFEITNQQTEAVVVEKTNQAIPVSGGPSEPYNPGTPSTGGTPQPTTPNNPDPDKPGTPVQETPGISVPGTIVTTPSVPSEENGGTDKPGNHSEESPSPSAPEAVDGEVTGPQVTEGEDTGEEGVLTPSVGEESESEGSSGNSSHTSAQGMLPKTGEESSMAYTVSGLMLIAIGSAGYLYFRRRERFQR